MQQSPCCMQVVGASNIISAGRVLHTAEIVQNLQNRHAEIQAWALARADARTGTEPEDRALQVDPGPAAAANCWHLLLHHRSVDSHLREPESKAPQMFPSPVAAANFAQLTVDVAPPPTPRQPLRGCCCTNIARASPCQGGRLSVAGLCGLLRAQGSSA